MNTLLRVVLLIWIFSYLFISCGPLLGGDLIIGTITALGGIVLFVPWVIGIGVLAILIRMTNLPRR